MARSVDTTFPRITSITTGKELFECAICLQTCIHPARLPCNHIFCYLCIKGIAYISRRCALCRSDIPPEFMENPVLVDNDLNGSSTQNDGYQWYYEGRHGWWQYDARSCKEIEDAFQRGEKLCTIMVAGYLYIINFETMEQLRQYDPTRRRLVKRDIATIAKKGIAGLRLPVPLPAGAGQSNYSAIDSNTIGSHRTRLLAAVKSARHAFDLMHLPTFLNNRANGLLTANTHAIAHAHAAAAAATVNANDVDDVYDDEDDEEEDHDHDVDDEENDDEGNDDLDDLDDIDEGLTTVSDNNGDDNVAGQNVVDENDIAAADTGASEHIYEDADEVNYIYDDGT